MARVKKGVKIKIPYNYTREPSPKKARVFNMKEKRKTIKINEDILYEIILRTGMFGGGWNSRIIAREVWKGIKNDRHLLK